MEREELELLKGLDRKATELKVEVRGLVQKQSEQDETITETRDMVSDLRATLAGETAHREEIGKRVDRVADKAERMHWSALGALGAALMAVLAALLAWALGD